MTVMQNTKITNKSILAISTSMAELSKASNQVVLRQTQKHFFNVRCIDLVLMAKQPNLKKRKKCKNAILKEFNSIYFNRGFLKRSVWLKRVMPLLAGLKYKRDFHKGFWGKATRTILLRKQLAWSKIVRFLIKSWSKKKLARAVVKNTAVIYSYMLANKNKSSGFTNIGFTARKKLVRSTKKTQELVESVYKTPKNFTSMPFSKYKVSQTSLVVNSSFFFKSRISALGKNNSDFVSKIYKNTFYASLYNEYGDYAKTFTINKVSFFSKMVNCLNSSISTKQTETAPGMQRRSVQTYSFDVRDNYLKAFGPASTMLRRKNYLTIRFTPGYLPFFRKIRANFIRTRGLSLGRQYRLTNYLVKYKRLSNLAMFKMYTFELTRVLTSIKFASSLLDAVHILKNNKVFINGLPVRHASFQVQTGDIVSLHVEYFTYIKLLDSFSCMSDEIIRFYRSTVRFNDLYFNKSSVVSNIRHKYLLAQQKKVKLTRVERVYSLIRDIPSYFEVDFLTISAAIIFDPRRANDFDKLFTRTSAFSFIQMLN